MDEKDRAQEIVRLWPRLRAEAHELYREASILRGRVREMERRLATSEDALRRLQADNERLARAEQDARSRLSVIERSRGWMAITQLRRARRRLLHKGEEASPQPAPVQNNPAPAREPAEPTFSQRWAAQVRRRAEVRTALIAWMDVARTAPGDAIVAVAADGSDMVGAFVARCLEAGDPVCEIDAVGDPDGIRGALPGVEPSLVP
ncbi:MAG TPA: hypothetical protein VGW79_00420, partial [Actinomycetota bacterium]|nr:hypothetical protein [Actinomycetota bacterium]